MYNESSQLPKGEISLLKRLHLDRRMVARVFLLTALFFFAAHIYRFTSAAFSHDSLLLNQSDDRSFQISLGRFLQPLYWKLRGDIPAPFLVGLAAYAFLSASILLIVRLLDLRSTLSVALVCAVLSANSPLILAGGTFISWMDVYMLALLLAVLGVFVCARFRFGFLAAPLLLCASLALYQSYICAAALLMLILLVRSLLLGISPAAVVREAFADLFALLGGLVLYACSLKAVLLLTDETLSNTYNGLSGVGQYGGVSVSALLRDTYLYPFRCMSAPETHLSRFAALAILAVFLLGGLCLVRLLRARRLSLPAVLLSLLAVLLMPFAANATYFISKGIIHTAMIYPFFLAFVFPIFLAEQAAPDGVLLRRARTAIAALLLFFYGCNLVTAHQLYLRRDLEFQSTLSVMTRVIDRMEQIEGYDPGYTPVAVVGNLSDSYLGMERPGFEHLSSYGSNPYAITYLETSTWYLWQMLGYPVNLVDSATQHELALREDVRAIPSFPDRDCCRMIDGVLVVRIGVPGISY